MAKKLTASDMGKLGGPARAKALPAAERKRIARLGGLARSKQLKRAKAAKDA
jgi:hypothetical protein